MFLNTPRGRCGWWMLAVLSASGTVHAEPDPASRWRAANQAVAEFPRGHADIIRWERNHAPTAQPSNAARESQPLTLAQVREWAPIHKPELFAWDGTSPQEAQSLRIDMTAWRLGTETAWIEAVAAQHMLELKRQQAQATHAASELGRRMTTAGNWNLERQLREELRDLDAQTELERAELEAQMRLETLAQRLGLDPSTTWTVPSRLPDLPAANALGDSLPALETEALAQHPRWALVDLQAQRHAQGVTAEQLSAVQQALSASAASTPSDQVPAIHTRQARLSPAAIEAWTLRAQANAIASEVRSAARQAWHSWTTVRQWEQRLRNEILPREKRIEEETILRYNGMLASTWDVLAASRSRLDREAQWLMAQRDAWLAYVHLQGVLKGVNVAAPKLSDTPSAPSDTGGH